MGKGTFRYESRKRREEDMFVNVDDTVVFGEKSHG